MKSLRVQLDESTYQALDRMTAKHQRAEFVRKAIRDAVQAQIDARTQAAYVTQPAKETFADDWSGTDAWELMLL
jgi:metal-responsive CopG/Arc/MetJ family transcriptional regulator